MLSKEIGALRSGKGGAADFVTPVGENPIAQAEFESHLKDIKEQLPKLESQERASIEELDAFLAALPNIPAEDVPRGVDESGNEEVSRWGEPPKFAFQPKEHADIGPPLGLEFDTAVAMSGARFAFLRGQMARLERALGQFMLDLQTQRNGYVECIPPLLVRDEAVFGTGQLPKFADDLFSTDISLGANEYAEFKMAEFKAREAAKGREVRNFLQVLQKDIWDSLPNPNTRRWLIPTSEVSLTNSVREQILGDLSQPIRLTALTPCFRSEAGAAGKDTRGYIRQHQFSKVELVAICRPEDWQAEHEHMVASAEGVLQALGLPYRKMLLCTGDMGATAKKTFDLEVWLPGQGAYREISSVSWCGDYQARRMNARYRPEGRKGTEFVHTLNGSGLAVGRTLVAVLEICQQADGSVTVPAALMPYMGGLDTLTPAR
jgi:seryl-tRNA synthetase